jgi:hypothetical protein
MAESCANRDPSFRVRPLPDPKHGDSYPSSEELVRLWSSVTDAAIAAFIQMPDDDLLKPSQSGRATEPFVESCLRVVHHQNSHLLQIWRILGSLQKDDRYPDQGI